MEVNVYNHRDKGRFYTIVRGQEAFMKYARPDTNTLEIQSTYIPEGLRGQGIARQMAEFACSYAQNRHLKVKPTCPYFAQFLENDPVIYQMVTVA